MTSYILTFTVYTTAMIGAIFLALFVYKKCSVNNSRVSASKFLEIEDCVSLGVRKQLYVVRAGSEKFLIASDAERTTFLSKLQGGEVASQTLPEHRPEINRARDIEFDMENLYSGAEVVRKDATTILRNIISSPRKFREERNFGVADETAKPGTAPGSRGRDGEELL